MPGRPDALAPDLILVNGAIHTVDDANPRRRPWPSAMGGSSRSAATRSATWPDRRPASKIWAERRSSRG